MPPTRTFRHIMVWALSSLWLILLLLAPAAALVKWPWSKWVYVCFSGVCHQLPERSFYLLGYPLAVCHRCTGLYFGLWLGIAVLPFVLSLSGRLWERPRALVWFALPMLVDVMIDNTAASRFATGLLAGFPLGLFLWAAAEQLPPLRDFFGGDSHGSKA